MFGNYFYLNRAVIELRKRLLGKRIIDIYSQEKDKLYLAIPEEENEYSHLIFSANNNLPYLMIKENHRKAKKNTFSLFGELTPKVITDIAICSDDRIVKITLADSAFYFVLQGSRTNIYATYPDRTCEAFKKIKGQDISEVVRALEEKEYLTEPNIIDFPLESITNTEYKSIKKVFPYISKPLFNEIKTLCATDSREDFAEQYYLAIKEILLGNISVGFNFASGKPFFVSEKFNNQNKDAEHEEFYKYNDALHQYLSEKYRNERIIKLKSEIESSLEKELSGLSNKLNNLSRRIEKGSREEEYYHIGNLLLASRHLLSKGNDSVEVWDYLSEENKIVKINPKHSPQEAIDYYFEKARDEKTNYGISFELFEKTKKRYEKFVDINKIYASATDLKKLTEIKTLLTPANDKRNKKLIDEQIKAKEYIIAGKYHLFVGRDSKSNDKLTIKFAKQNDYWFHARGLPGSHVVLRVDNPKEGIPKDILKKAASVAAYYSKAKTAGVAPVSYTLRKFVTKRKGMEPGKVMLSKESVLLVKPEIPKDCEEADAEMF